SCATRLDVVLRVLAHLVERKDTRSRLLENGLIDVGRVDPRTVVDLLLLEQDRERVDLLPGGAACHPDSGERIRAQGRNDFRPESRCSPKRPTRSTSRGRPSSPSLSGR